MNLQSDTKKNLKNIIRLFHVYKDYREYRRFLFLINSALVLQLDDRPFLSEVSIMTVVDN